MAYRNGTYIAFHAEGKTDPTASDIKYYRMLKAWHENDGTNFRFVNSHEKVDAVKDTASKQKIVNSLKERLDCSKNFVLILGPKTNQDTDFVPFEIQYAADECNIPFIIVYTEYTGILNPGSHRVEWPAALRARIDKNSISVIHIPFKRGLIDDAIGRYNLTTKPDGSLVHYKKEFQERHGVTFAK
jgi:hypothetical protein